MIYVFAEVGDTLIIKDGTIAVIPRTNKEK